MRTFEMTVYKFDELSDDAKERAHTESLASGNAWSWSDEWQDSLSAFCNIAPVNALRYDVDAGHVDYEWSHEYANDISGVRAWVWLNNHGWREMAERNADGTYTLTGFCGDCSLFDVIAAYMRGDPRRVPDLEQVFYECLQSWCYAARADKEHSESAEAFAESCDANEYEFDESGCML
jgi:hypothetical protein